jgi:uncharacterized membrane protein YecN with MAPEG domain
MMHHVPAHIAAAGLYVGLLILMSLVLQFRVIRLRRSKLIGIGDGQDKELARAIRVHGNFTESVPFGMAGLVMLALIDAQAVLIHGVGLLLLAGRIAHAVGLSRTAGKSAGRVAGMIMTLFALGVAALALIAAALWR